MGNVDVDGEDDVSLDRGTALRRLPVVVVVIAERCWRLLETARQAPVVECDLRRFHAGPSSMPPSGRRLCRWVSWGC